MEEKEKYKNRKIYFIGPPELYKEEDNQLYINSTIEACIEWIKTLTEVSVDTETEGFFDHSNRIIMLQLSDGKDIWVIDVRNNRHIFSLLKPYLEKILVLGQNLKFDYKFLKLEGIELETIYDTFLAECILTNGKEWNIVDEKSGKVRKGRELGLGKITERYLGIALDKSIRNQFVGLEGKPFTHKQIVYGSEDVLYLPKIRNKQMNLIFDLELENWLELENDACLAMADIEYNGLGFNPEAWLELNRKVESNLPQYEKDLDRLVIEDNRLSAFVNKYIQNDLFGGVGRPVNVSWSSPTQVYKVIKALGLDVPSSEAKELSRFENEYPLIKKLIDYKKDAKLVTTYGKDFLRFINPITKRIHGDFWQILNTGRVSCGGSKSGKSSVNLQNLPAKNEYLNCFVAEKGKLIVGIDYAAQEARVAASGSKDELWLATFIEGKDLHSEVCKLMFKITDDLVKTKPDFLRGKTYRDAAKTINFGVLFGMSEFKLSKSLSITVKEAQDLIEQYFAATKQLKKYLDSCANYGLKHGYIRSFKPYSGIRYFPDWRPDLNRFKDSKLIGEITRASYNTPVQMTAALMTKLALVDIRKYIKKHNLQNRVKLIHVVHDATYCEVDEDYAEEFSKIQAQIMIEAGVKFQISLAMDTDITIAPYWSK